MEKKTIYTIFISLGVIFLLLGGYSLITGTPLFLSSYDTCHGGTVSSIDDVQIRTSSDLSGKQVVRVTFSSIETGECLDIEASEGNLRDYLEDEGFSVEDPIVGDIELTKTQQIYDLRKDTSDKYFKLIEEDVGKELSCSKSKDCPSKSGATLMGVYLNPNTYTWDNCVCVYKSEEGVGGVISGGVTLFWETKISIGGSSVVLNNNKLSGKIGNFAHVKWNGNDMGNKILDNPDYDLYFDYGSNKFSLVKDGTHGEIEDDYDSIIRDLVSSASSGKGKGDLGSVISSYNSLVETSTKNLLDDYIDDETLVGDAEIDDNELIVDVSASKIAYPKFIVDVEASRVGIFQTIGKPEVDCPNDFSINSGDDKNVYAKISNKGSSTGSFGYMIDCNDGSQEATPDSPLSIAKGGIKQIKINAANTVSSGTENTKCKFTAYEINSGDEDSCSFDYDSTYVSQCSEGTKSCEEGNSVLSTCREDGGYDEIDCGFGCESFENSFRCKKQGEICNDDRDNDGNGLVDGDDPACKDRGFWDSITGWFSDLFSGFFDFFTMLKLAIVVIFSIVSVFVSSDLLNQIDSLKEIKAARWIISVIIGVGLAFLLYTFIYSFWFWIILIAGLTYLMYGKPIVKALRITGR